MRKSSTREDILNAAALEIVERGYAASSLASIAARLGLTKGALVRKFPAKEDFAWGITDSLSRVVSEESARSREVYPASGVKSLTRFLLAVSARTFHEPQVAAAAVLMNDRASPTFELAQVFDDLTRAIHGFLALAGDAGELEAQTDLQEMADYIFIITTGEASYSARFHAPERGTPRLRFLRLALRYAGVANVDSLIDEVITSSGAGSIEQLPPHPGLNRDQ